MGNVDHAPLKVSREIFVDHEVRLKTNLNKVLEQGTMTEKPLPKKEIDLTYHFEYGIDKQIQVIESEIFNFDKEVEPLVVILTTRVLEDSYLDVLRDYQITTLRTKQD